MSPFFFVFILLFVIVFGIIIYIVFRYKPEEKEKSPDKKPEEKEKSPDKKPEEKEKSGYLPFQINLGSKLTFCLWFKAEKMVKNYALISNSPNDLQNGQLFSFDINIIPSKSFFYIECRARINQDKGVITTHITEYKLNDWVFYSTACDFATGKCEILKNGEYHDVGRLLTFASKSPIFNNVRVGIGKYVDDDKKFIQDNTSIFPGEIRNVAFYKEYLSQEHLTDIFKSQKP
jgi:hypothetical protein